MVAQQGGTPLCTESYRDTDHLLSSYGFFFTVEKDGLLHRIGNMNSKEDMRPKMILEQMTRRISDCFEIGVLWRTDNANFPDSFSMATRLLVGLETRIRNASSSS